MTPRELQHQPDLDGPALSALRFAESRGGLAVIGWYLAVSDHETTRE